MTLIQTFKGKRFDLLNHTLEELDIEDIAHALGNICRFGGQIPQFYSVAQHCVLMSQLADWKFRLSALMHDASEAYIGDVTRHLKIWLGKPYADIEHRLMLEIAEKFGFTWPMPQELKKLDGDVVETEMVQLFPKYPGCQVYGHVLPISIIPASPWTSGTDFLRRYQEITSV